MSLISSLDQGLQLFIITTLALILGSFASLVSHRLAVKQPIIFARSRCVNCDAVLKPLNLIPLISWIFQGGKCSKCKAKISLRYPAIEMVFALSFLVIFFALGKQIDERMIVYFFIAATLIVMTIVDLEHYFIPDCTQYLLAILAAIVAIMDGGTNGAIINLKAAFIYTIFGLGLWGFFYFTTRLDALGIDDMKFFFIAGIMLGVNGFLPFMLLSGIFGAVFGLAWQKLKDDETFPFAPALCLALFLCLLFRKQINPLALVESLIF